MCFIGYVICEAPPSFARKCRCMVATQWFPPAIELLLFFSFFLILCFTIFTCWTKMTLPSTVPRRRVPHTTNDCVQLRTVCRLIKTWQLLCTIEGGAWLCRKHCMVICFFFLFRLSSNHICAGKLSASQRVQVRISGRHCIHQYLTTIYHHILIIRIRIPYAIHSMS